MNKIVLAIIPARGGSKGLPRKNVLPLAGVPLVGHTIAAAKDSRLVTDILVNTDDDEIQRVAADLGVSIQRRPIEMGSDTAKVDGLLIWSVTQYEQTTKNKVDIVVLLYPTAPLRTSKSIDSTIDQVLNENFDSALSLVADTDYLWKSCQDGTASPTNYDPANRAPRQIEQWNQWRENKAVYAMKRDLLLETRCRLGGRIGYHEMPSIESIDIDCAEDLAMAEAILESGNLNFDQE